MPSLNMPVQRLMVAILPLDLPCSGPVIHSGEILTTDKSRGKKPISLEDSIKIVTDEVEWVGMDWFDLAQDRDTWRAVMNEVKKFGCHKTGGIC